MSNYVKPKGIVTFKASDKAPDFIKGSAIITLDDFNDFCNSHPEYLSEYQGKKQIKLTILDGEYGINFQVDTYKPKPESIDSSVPEDESDSLPF